MVEKIKEIFKLIKEQIEIKAKECGLNDHSGETGDQREKIIRNFLISLLPKFFQYGKGIIIDSSGTKSKQQDVIIYSPYLSVFTEDSKLFPSDSVCSTIEIKSYLNKGELEKCLKNIKSVKNLKRMDSSKIICNIFAYNGNSKDTLLKNLNFLKQKLDIKEDELFDNLCIHGKYFITKNPILKVLSKSNENYDYLFMNLKELSLPYFLDSMINSIEIPHHSIPIFIKYLGNFKFEGEEWKLN